MLRAMRSAAVVAVLGALVTTSSVGWAARRVLTGVAAARVRYQDAVSAYRAASGQYAEVVTALRRAARDAKSKASFNVGAKECVVLAKAMNAGLAGVPGELRGDVRPMSEVLAFRFPLARNDGKATPAALTAQAGRLLELADALEEPETEAVRAARANLAVAEKDYATAMDRSFKAQVIELKKAQRELKSGKRPAGNTLFALASEGMQALAGQASYAVPNAVTGQFSASFSQASESLFSWGKSTGRASGTTFNRTSPLPPVKYNITIAAPAGISLEHYRTPLEAREAILAAAIASQAIWALQKNAKTVELAATLTPWLMHSSLEISGAATKGEASVDLMQGARALAGVGRNAKADSLFDGILTQVQREALLGL